ncbi:AAA domain [Maribacter aquivivus]|uniref:AAA domain n=1 Tax=Maribacter aquivivus TaxID=228958 RepID=A0A1M6TTA8_9FLAO|nr:AAA family ATPase [Maribacter aquivivus]SHK60156.1 AAA domain [Maribacter aquivivus]
MSGFRLLAIRPSNDCDKQFLKNLNQGDFYKFYQDYDFVIDEKENNVVEVKYKSSVPKSLYGENISVSAVVGKNGSGKSTIVELLSLFVFCLAKQLDLIKIEDFKESHRLSVKDQKRIDDEIKRFKLFNCEIYFLIDEEIHGLIKNKQGFESISYIKTLSNDQKEELFTLESKLDLSNLSKESEKNEFLTNSFFYSILANYSLYGLNTNETGIWLRSIFHKNDGYQTPIVLNPMRTEGKIDINRLTYLSKSRLLGNVFKELEEGQKEEDSLRSLVNNKIVHKITLQLDFTKFTIVDENNLKPGQKAIDIIDIDDKSIYLEYTERNKNRNKHDYFSLLIKAFFPENDFVDVSFSNSKIKRICKEYILKKVEDVIKKYPQFKAFKNRVFRVNTKQEIIEQCFSRLAVDFTHSTFKIRQALNFLVYDLYNLKNRSGHSYELSTTSKKGIVDKVNNKRKEILNSELKENEQLFEINPNESDIENNNKDSYRRHSLTNYLPPSFFEIDFEFKNEGSFKDLSSGEKQIIYSINSVVYHLINLDSIYSMDIEDGLSYKCFNIVLDEIELYFHPEFQRVFINELIKSINSFRGFNYNYNIIFLTHSPFILSDIPTSNILKLDKGNIQNNNREEETYAANVHDLLANDFFLENGFMGEYAKQKIKDLLRYLTYDEGKGDKIDNEKPKLKWNPILAEEFIKIIGEPLLKFDLRELYLSKFFKEERIDAEIERLQELKRTGRDDFN